MGDAVRAAVTRHLGQATPDRIEAETLHEILVLLTEADTTPDQRATLIEVLGEFPDVEPIAAASDQLGREGHGVEIPVAGATPVRVLLDPATSELLEWSQVAGAGGIGELHTIAATGHVGRVGER